MDRYTRILVAIFIVALINLGLTIFNLNNSEKPVVIVNSPSPTMQIQAKSTPVATPSAITKDDDIKTDLNVVKAELKAIRDILEP